MYHDLQKRNKRKNGHSISVFNVIGSNAKMVTAIESKNYFLLLGENKIKDIRYSQEPPPSWSSAKIAKIAKVISKKFNYQSFERRNNLRYPSDRPFLNGLMD